MSTNTRRTLRKDLSMLASLVLLGLVALSALTGAGMDEPAEEILPVDDVHPVIGYTMAIVAAAHALLNLGAMRRHLRRRLRDLAGTPAGRDGGAGGVGRDAVPGTDCRGQRKTVSGIRTRTR